MVADPALGRAATEVVLDSVAGEDLDRPVIHVDREVDGELATRLAQDEAHPGIEIEAFGRQIELALGHFPGVDRRGHMLCGHGVEFLRGGRPSWTASSVWAVSRTTPRGAPPGRMGPLRTDDARLMQPEYTVSQAASAYGWSRRAT